MSTFVSVAEAKTLPGLRLALSRQTPGPWGEAARNIFEVKQLPYVRVSQYPGEPNEELQAWTGHNNAPVAVYGDERPVASWFGILMLAERLAPTPPLVPEDEADRVQMFGLCHEVCGEDGLNWNRRLQLVALWEQVGTETDQAFRTKIKTMYGYSPETAARAGSRVRAILAHLARQLQSQQQRGSRYLVGERLTAADIHLATGLALFHPLPQDQCPMDESIRPLYAHLDDETRAALNPILLAHREHMYRQHLSLPLAL